MEYQRVTDYCEGGENHEHGLRITIKPTDGKQITLQLKSKGRMNTGSYCFLEMERYTLPQYKYQSQIDRELCKIDRETCRSASFDYNRETWEAYKEYIFTQISPEQKIEYEAHWAKPVEPIKEPIKANYNTVDFKRTDKWNVVLDINGKTITLPLTTTANPFTSYDCPSNGPINFHRILDGEVILFVRQHPCEQPPIGSRRCETGEYDQYLYTQVKAGTLPVKDDDVNVAVWEAFMGYIATSKL